MAKIDFQMVITDEAITYARFAQKNSGWSLTPKRWAISTSSGELTSTRTTDSMYEIWVSQPFSGVHPSGTNKLLHSLVIPPDAYATDMNIGEIYFIYEDYYGNEFLYAIAQPTVGLTFTYGVSQSYIFAFTLNNTNVADTFTINYTYPQDIEDHNRRSDSHENLVARDGTRPATGILSYETKLNFTSPRQIVDKEYTDNVTQVIQSAIDQSYCPPGTLMMWPQATPPSGWLVRDGSAISRTTYKNLFDVIGTSFGEGNGTTTFNLPDDRGKVIQGYDSNSSNLLGATYALGGSLSGMNMGARYGVGSGWVATQDGWIIGAMYSSASQVGYIYIDGVMVLRNWQGSGDKRAGGFWITSVTPISKGQTVTTAGNASCTFAPNSTATSFAGRAYLPIIKF